MLETFNDYISLIVMVVLVIFSIRLMIAAFVYDDDHREHKTNSVFFGYSDNEDE